MPPPFRVVKATQTWHSGPKSNPVLILWVYHVFYAKMGQRIPHDVTMGKNVKGLGNYHHYFIVNGVKRCIKPNCAKKPIAYVKMTK